MAVESKKGKKVSPKLAVVDEARSGAKLIIMTSLLLSHFTFPQLCCNNGVACEERVQGEGR